MIRAEQLHYYVNGSTILRDITLNIPKGKVTAILGANGAGKSTLLKCLTGAAQPTQGCVTIDNKNLSEHSLSELSQTRAVLSQTNSINFPFSAYEIAMMGRSPYSHSPKSKQDNVIVRAALEQVDAWHLKDRIFPTLSGGEQQRVHLARVLAQLWENHDSYLFLDEPTSALDLKHQHLILQLAREKSREGMGIITILHDIYLAHSYADHVVLLKEGTLFADGRVEDVLTKDHISDVFDVQPHMIHFLHPAGKEPVLV